MLSPNDQRLLELLYEDFNSNQLRRPDLFRAALADAETQDPEFVGNLRQKYAADRAPAVEGPTSTWEALPEGFSRNDQVGLFGGDPYKPEGLAAGALQVAEAVPIVGGIVDPIVETPGEREDASTAARFADAAGSFTRNIGEFLIPGGALANSAKGLKRADQIRKLTGYAAGLGAAQSIRETGVPIPGQEGAGQKALQAGAAGLFAGAGVPFAQKAQQFGAAFQGPVRQFAAEAGANVAYDISTAAAETALAGGDFTDPRAWAPALAASVGGSALGFRATRNPAADPNAPPPDAPPPADPIEGPSQVRPASKRTPRGRGFQADPNLTSDGIVNLPVRRQGEFPVATRPGTRPEPPTVRVTPTNRGITLADQSSPPRGLLTGGQNPRALIEFDPSAAPPRDPRQSLEEYAAQLNRANVARQGPSAFTSAPQGREGVRVDPRISEQLLREQNPGPEILGQQAPNGVRRIQDVEVVEPPPPVEAPQATLRSPDAPQEGDLFGDAPPPDEIPPDAPTVPIDEDVPLEGEIDLFGDPPPPETASPTVSRETKANLTTDGPLFENVPLSRIATRLSDFQHRENAFSQKTARDVAERGFDPVRSARQPPQFWEDPATGEFTTLAGHSRTEGLRASGELDYIPGIVHRGIPLSEAKLIAAASNQSGDAPTLLERSKAVGMLKGDFDDDAIGRELGVGREEARRLRTINEFPEELKNIMRRGGDQYDSAMRELADAVNRGLSPELLPMIGDKLVKGTLPAAKTKVKGYADFLIEVARPTDIEGDLFGGTGFNFDQIDSIYDNIQAARSSSSRLKSALSKSKSASRELPGAVVVNEKQAKAEFKRLDRLSKALGAIQMEVAGREVKLNAKESEYVAEIKRRLREGEPIGNPAEIEGYLKGERARARDERRANRGGDAAPVVDEGASSRPEGDQGDAYRDDGGGGIREGDGGGRGELESDGDPEFERVSAARSVEPEEPITARVQLEERGKGKALARVKGLKQPLDVQFRKDLNRWEVRAGGKVLASDSPVPLSDTPGAKERANKVAIERALDKALVVVDRVGAKKMDESIKRLRAANSAVDMLPRGTKSRLTGEEYARQAKVASRFTDQDAATMERGKKAVRSEIDRAEKSKKLTPSAAGIARQMLDKMPWLEENLAVQVKADASGPRGAFDSTKNLVTIAKMLDGDDPAVAAHELFHASEKFLSPDERATVLAEWRRDVDAERDRAKKGAQRARREGNEAEARYYRERIAFLGNVLDGTAKIDQTPDADLYRFLNPSEWFADAMAKIETSRFRPAGATSAADKTVLGLAISKVKDLFRAVWEIVSPNKMRDLWRSLGDGRNRSASGGMLRDVFQTADDLERFATSASPSDSVFLTPREPLPGNLESTMQTKGGLPDERGPIRKIRDGLAGATNNLGDRVIRAIFNSAWGSRKLERDRFTHTATYKGETVTLPGLSAEDSPYQASLRAQNSSAAVNMAIEKGQLTLDKDGIITVDESKNGLMEILEDAGKEGKIDWVTTHLAGLRLVEEKQRWNKRKGSLAQKESLLKTKRAELVKLGRTMKTRKRRTTAEIKQWAREKKRLTREIEDLNEQIAPLREYFNAVKNPLGAFTDVEVKEMVDLGKQTIGGKTVANVADEFNGWVRSFLDFAEEAGIVDPSARANWERASYLPFFKELEDKALAGTSTVDILAPLNSGGVTDLDNVIQRYTGSDRKLGDLLENVTRMAVHMSDNSMRNIAALKTVDTYGGDPSLMTKLSGPPIGKGGKDDGFISVFRDGKREYWQVHDEGLLKSLVMLDGPQWGSSMRNVLKVLGLPGKALRTGVVLNPTFSAVNMFRDSLTAWMSSNEPVTPLNVFASFVKAYRKVPALKRIMESGSGGTFYSKAPEASAKRLRADLNRKKYHTLDPRRAPAAFVDFVRRVTEASEMASRVAIYEAAIKRGATDAEALRSAQNFINYNLHGESKIVGFLGATQPFFSARLAGLYRTGTALRELKTDPKAVDFLLNKTAAMGGMMAAASMALTAHNWSANREEFDELEEFEKDNYWHFYVPGPSGEKLRFRLPKPFEFGAIFATVPERAIAAILPYSEDKGDMKLVADRIGKIVTQTFEVPLTPSHLYPYRPIAELRENFSQFSDRPIETASDQELRPEARYGAGTTRSARALAELAPDFVWEDLRSPKKFEHLVRGYLGSLGAMTLGAADMMIGDLLGGGEVPEKGVHRYPVIKGFFGGDADDQYSRYVSAFYKDLSDVFEIYKTVQEYRKRGDLEKAKALAEKHADALRKYPAYIAAVKRIGTINRDKARTAMDERMSASEKRARIKDRDLERSRIAELVYRRANPQ